MTSYALARRLRFLPRAMLTISKSLAEKEYPYSPLTRNGSVNWILAKLSVYVPKFAHLSTPRLRSQTGLSATPLSGAVYVKHTIVPSFILCGRFSYRENCLNRYRYQHAKLILWNVSSDMVIDGSCVLVEWRIAERASARHTRWRNGKQ